MYIPKEGRSAWTQGEIYIHWILVFNTILNISHCNIRNGEESIFIGSNTLNWLDGNLEEDPLFVGDGAYPFALSELSLCINAGTPDTTGLNIYPFDLAGNP